MEQFCICKSHKFLYKIDFLYSNDVKDERYLSQLLSNLNRICVRPRQLPYTIYYVLGCQKNRKSSHVLREMLVGLCYFETKICEQLLFTVISCKEKLIFGR